MFTPNTSSPQAKSRRAKAGPGPGQFSVADGQQAVGTIKQVGDNWTATTVTGERLGPYPSMTEAARALPRIPEVLA